MGNYINNIVTILFRAVLAALWLCYFSLLCTYQGKPVMDDKPLPQTCGTFIDATISNQKVTKYYPDLDFILSKRRELDLAGNQLQKLQKMNFIFRQECMSDKLTLTQLEDDLHAYAMAKSQKQLKVSQDVFLQTMAGKFEKLVNLRKQAIRNVYQNYLKARKKLSKKQNKTLDSLIKKDNRKFNVPETDK